MNNKEIAAAIKLILEADAIKDFVSLSKIDLTKVKNESRVGNKFVDYFTFKERLATKTRKGMNFYEFSLDLKYHQRPYIKNLLVKQEGLKINELTKLYRIYCLHCGSVSLFKPLKALEVYKRFNPSVAVLDPCCGWGGRLVGAVVAKVPHYIGIDLNVNLKEPYKKMIEKLNELTNPPLGKLEGKLEGNARKTVGFSKIETHFCDAAVFDYSSCSYDMIFTSPPYFNTELYSYTNKKTNIEWIETFYKPVFLNAWANLLVDGWLIVNISIVIYNAVFVEMFGLAQITIPMNNKTRPKCAVKEFIYCWQKCASLNPKGTPLRV